MYNRHRVILLLAIVVVGLTAGAGWDVPHSQVSGNHLTPDDPQFWATQDMLDAVAQRIQGASRGDPAFSSVSVDALSDSVIIHRVGGDPRSAAPAQSRMYAGAVPAGVVLRYETATLSLSQVNHLNALLKPYLGQLDVQTWGLESPNGPYLVAYGNPSLPPSQRLKDELQIYGAGTVVFKHELAHPLARLSDRSPFWGGARLVGTWLPGIRAGQVCTSGFGTYSGINHGYYVTTAAHCVNPRDTRVWTGESLLMSDFIDIDGASDTAFVKVSALGYEDEYDLYDGPNGQDAHDKEVVGVRSPVEGDWACSSGSVIRVVCAEKFSIYRPYQYRNPYTGQLVDAAGWVVEPAEAANATIAAEGDSGGPVFSLVNNNTKAVARGGISLGLGAYRPCPSWVLQELPKDRCYGLFLASDMGLIASSHHLSFAGFPV